jgi:hypothetical protein
VLGQVGQERQLDFGDVVDPVPGNLSDHRGADRMFGCATHGADPVHGLAKRRDTIFKVRQRFGPVAVFDPQGLATGLSATTRWSPI